MISDYFNKNQDVPELFDVITFRAFSDFKTCIRLAFPLLKKGGKMIAMKGRDADNEMKDLHPQEISFENGSVVQAGSLKTDVFRYELPVISSERVIVSIYR